MAATPSNQERRQYKRIEDTFPVLYRIKSPFAVRVQLGEKEMDAVAQDISEGGAGIYSNHEVPLGTMVNLHFKILNDTAFLESERYRFFDLNGEVRYSILAKDRSYRLGILFSGTTGNDREYIAGYVRDKGLRPT